MRRLAFCIAALLFVGCSSGDTLFGDKAGSGGASAETSGASTTGSGDGGGEAQATGSGQGGASSASGAQSGSGGSPSAQSGSGTGAGTSTGTSTGSNGPATSTAASTGSGGDLCTPKDADSLCTKCAKEKCCKDLTACVTDADCACWLGCKLQGNPGYKCDQQCSTWSNGKKISFETCTQVNCWQSCI